MTSVDCAPMAEGEPFPEVMQGRWIEDGDPTYEVIIRGHELIIYGEPVVYLARCLQSFEGGCEIEVTVPDQTDDGDALCLLHVSDDDKLDGDLFLYNVHFACPLVRAD